MEHETILPPTWPIIVLSIYMLPFPSDIWTCISVFRFSSILVFLHSKGTSFFHFSGFYSPYVWDLFYFSLSYFPFFFMVTTERKTKDFLLPPELLPFFSSLLFFFFFFILLGLLNGWVVGFSWSDVHPRFLFLFLSLSFTFWPSLVHLSMLLFIFCTDV